VSFFNSLASYLPFQRVAAAGNCVQLLGVVERLLMSSPDLELLEKIGLTLYERKAFGTLMLYGVADAETLCREGDVPSSKIYQALEKLGKLGLLEIQPTRPKLFYHYQVKRHSPVSSKSRRTKLTVLRQKLRA